MLGIDEIVDALVVDIPRPGTDGWMPLFVVLREGAELDDELRAEIARRVRERCSPRHVPDEVFEIAEVPRTLSGKVLEVPVKRILMGTPGREGGQPRLARQPGGARLLRRDGEAPSLPTYCLIAVAFEPLRSRISLVSPGLAGSSESSSRMRTIFSTCWALLSARTPRRR